MLISVKTKLSDKSVRQVNHFFAAMLVSRHPGLRYLNREEDVGDESLRYAKNSYHPLCKLRKYNVYLPKKA